jgi:hypothetical protein
MSQKGIGTTNHNFSIELPPLDEEGKLVLVPEEVLEVREKKLQNRVIRE